MNKNDAERWPHVRVGDVLTLRNGRAFKSSEWRTGGTPIIRIQNLKSPDAPFNYFDGELPDQFAARPGDLLFAWSGTPGTSFGAHVWNGPDAWVNQHIFRVDFPPEIFDRDFLCLALNENVASYIEQAQGGVGLAHITKAKLNRSTLPAPPLGEQRYVASLLRDIDAHRESIADRLAAARTTVERLRAAVLAAACSGRLTADWREEHPEERGTDMTAAADRRRAENRHFAVPTLNPHTSNADLPGTWRQAPLGLLLTGLQYGTSKRSAYETDGMPVLRIPNVSAGVITTADLKFADLGDREADTLKLRDGDLLMIRSNGSVGLVGMTAAVTKDAVGMAYAGYLIRLRVDAEFLLPGYLVLALASPDIRQQIELPARSTSGVHNINSREVRALALAVPSLPEQREIIRRAGGALGTADRLAEAIASADVALGSAIRGAISKAFQGELAVRRSVGESTSR